ncbi:MAG: hypothetical protein ACI308_11060 [Muribaculaceae bacterium]
MKDPIVYHRNGNNELPYLELGSLNCHESGIDVTFENEKKAFWASFLIRAYRLCTDKCIIARKSYVINYSLRSA